MRFEYFIVTYINNVAHRKTPNAMSLDEAKHLKDIMDGLCLPNQNNVVLHRTDLPKCCN